MARRHHRRAAPSLTVQSQHGKAIASSSACRAISASFEAHAAVRVMATMHAIGEAAGRAAGWARARGRDLAEVNGRTVRDELPYMNAALSF